MALEFKTQSGAVILKPIDGDGTVTVNIPRVTELASNDLSNVNETIFKDQVNKVVDFQNYKAPAPTLSAAADAINMSSGTSITVDACADCQVVITNNIGKATYDSSKGVISFIAPSITSNENGEKATISAYTMKDGFLHSDTVSVDIAINYVDMVADDALVDSDLQANESPDVNPNGFNFI